MSVPKVKLTLQPFPKSLVRVSVAGEFLRNLAPGLDADTRAVQQAVAEGLVSEIIVVGVNAAGIAKQRFILRFDPLGQDTTIHLDLTDGRSTTEALDTGFAGAMAYSVQLMRRRALSPNIYVVWSAEALSNPTNLAAACQRLNLTMNVPLPTFQPDLPAPPSLPPPQPASSPNAAQWRSEPPPPPTGHTYTTLLSIKPSKEPGITYRIEAARRT